MSMRWVRGFSLATLTVLAYIGASGSASAQQYRHHNNQHHHNNHQHQSISLNRGKENMHFSDDKKNKLILVIRATHAYEKVD